MAPHPFTLSVPDTALADLRNPPRADAFPRRGAGEPWAWHSVNYARDLVGYSKDR